MTRIFRTRAEIEAIERDRLAPFAQKSSETRGRVHPEPQHPYRMEYERDRQRVIHSRAFRRLEYKTQVFLNGTGDHLRTRLTHTMEVASISRTICRALGLNEDLAEAVALAHDLGHSPFGHSGEASLNALMRDHGGFDHNAQSVRIVELIEEKYPRFPGLNLSWEVREGLQKPAKSHGYASRAADLDCGRPSPSIEAQVADLADEIAYYSHDLDDGLDYQLITPEQLNELDSWCWAQEEVARHFPLLHGRELCSYTLRCMIDHQVHDVITASAAEIEASGVQSADEARNHARPLIRYSPALAAANKRLRSFLYERLYFHPKVHEANQRACATLERVFEAYLENPIWLGEATARRIPRDGLHRTVCDYLAGMTDRYLLDVGESLDTRSPLPPHPELFASWEYGAR